MRFVRSDNKDFENLESLYELEGNFDINVKDDDHYITNLSGKQEFSIPEARETDLTAIAEEAEEDTASAGEEADTELSEEEIDEQLQGEWVLNAGQGSVFSFDDGVMTVESDGMTLTGTYDINTEDSTINGHFKTNDGQIANVHLPYKIDDSGNLILMNNANVEMIKK